VAHPVWVLTRLLYSRGSPVEEGEKGRWAAVPTPVPAVQRIIPPFTMLLVDPAGD